VSQIGSLSFVFGVDFSNKVVLYANGFVSSKNVLVFLAYFICIVKKQLCRRNFFQFEPFFVGWNVFALPKKDLHARKMDLHA
jgi:hypothetical protein